MQTFSTPLKAKLDHLEASRGAVAFRRLRSLSLAVRLASVNRSELFRAVEALSKPPLFPRIWADASGQHFDEYHADLVRLLHNYLASVKTLVDLSRLLIRRGYSGSPLADAYLTRVADTVAQSPLVAFVHDLRNYTLHVGLPITSLRIRIGVGVPLGTADCGLDLLLEPLRKWKKWSSRGSAYLLSLTANPPVLPLLASYNDEVMALHAWLSAELEKHHEAELRAYTEGLRELLGHAPSRGV